MRCLLRFVHRVVFVFIVVWLALTNIQSQSTGVTSPAASVPASQNPYLGSAPEGKATAEVLQIDFTDAIERGLRNNLGVLLADDQQQSSRGQRWHELAELLPNLNARIMEDVQTQSLAALGFNKLFPLLAAPGSNLSNIPRLVPAFNFFDARISLDQSLFNYRNL